MPEPINNPKARHDYTILETYEAGIVLHGTEVKSLRGGKGQIGDAYARVDRGEVWLHNMQIDEYAQGNIHNHRPVAPRKLLLNRTEIRKLEALGRVKGNTLIPLSLYWKNGKVKIQLAVGEGKGAHDRRQEIKKRDSEREIKQAMSQHRKGR